MTQLIFYTFSNIQTRQRNFEKHQQKNFFFLEWTRIFLCKHERKMNESGGDVGIIISIFNLHLLISITVVYAKREKGSRKKNEKQFFKTLMLNCVCGLNHSENECSYVCKLHDESKYLPGWWWFCIKIARNATNVSQKEEPFIGNQARLMLIHANKFFITLSNYLTFPHIPFINLLKLHLLHPWMASNYATSTSAIKLNDFLLPLFI